jgi:hypothetical protein
MGLEDNFMIKKTPPGRSKIEQDNLARLTRMGIPFTYEEVKIDYTIPESKHTYLPDIILSNGIIVEVKGQFDADDRRKHLLLRTQHPELDIRFVFQKPNNKLDKRYSTTYIDWCNKHNFKFATMYIPKEWWEETK